VAKAYCKYQKPMYTLHVCIRLFGIIMSPRILDQKSFLYNATTVIGRNREKFEKVNFSVLKVIISDSPSPGLGFKKALHTYFDSKPLPNCTWDYMVRGREGVHPPPRIILEYLPWP
jgi:hypothetical protein